MSTIAATQFLYLIGETLACPYFAPTAVSNEIAWLHPSRLPLGAGFEGHCDAPGYEGCAPTSEQIKEHCNMGYALSCTRLPENRECDAVRFGIVRESAAYVTVWFIFETAHRPAGHGTLEFNISNGQWITVHPTPRIQKLADCYVHAYLARKHFTPHAPLLETDAATQSNLPKKDFNAAK